MIRSILAALVGLIVTTACSESSSSASASAPPVLLALPGGSVTMTVQQRSTTPIQGSGGKIRLSIDDVTRGQVRTSISTVDGDSVLAPISMRAGESSDFKVDGYAFTVTLDALQNNLIGTDRAIFTFTGPSAASPLSEEAKIHMLIDRMRKLDGATFIRNGSAHDAEGAAAHLELKWGNAKGDIESAREFIDKIASRSSISGEAYRIRLANGTESDAEAYFNSELKKIENGDV